MKNAIIVFSLFILFGVAGLQQGMAQSTQEKTALVSFEQMSASKGAVLGKLTYGKFNGFDQKENAFAVKAADATPETFDKLLEEIKFKFPEAIVRVMVTEKTIITPAVEEKNKN